MASGTGLDLCEATHAEANALLQCRDPDLISACYVTTAPCVSCVKLLVNTGCRRVVFEDDYAASGERLWLSSEGREWVRL
jgi:dCMP deaminase